MSKIKQEEKEKVMKIKIALCISLFLLVFTNDLFSQKDYKVVENDTNYLFRNKRGFWDLKHELPDGTYFVYKLKYKYIFKDKDYKKICDKYYSIYIQGAYANKLKEGTFKTYSTFYSKNQYYLRCIENYKSGILNGKYSEWYNKKNKEVEGEFIDGKKNGWWYYWNEFSIPTFHIFYKNDTINELVTYNKNGTLKYKIKGINGMIEDTVLLLNKDGMKEYEGYYKLGRLQYWKKWNNEGELILESQGDFSDEKLYLNNIYDCLSCPYFFHPPRNGKMIFWNNEVISDEKTYKNGELINSGKVP